MKREEEDAVEHQKLKREKRIKDEEEFGWSKHIQQL